MYRKQEVQTKILDVGKKTLDGAIEFISNSNMMGKQTVLLVGSNDLSSKSATEVFKQINKLCDIFQKKFHSCDLNIMPILPRPYNNKYNREAAVLNEKLNYMNKHNVSVVSSMEIRESDIDFFNRDNIHLNQDGNIQLVRAIKTHMNPKLGLPEYTTYSRQSRSTNELLKDSRNRSFHQRQRSPEQRRPRRRDDVNEKRDLICRLLGI